MNECPHCGQTFSPERSDARWCSDACRAAAWRQITHRSSVHDPDGWPIPAGTYGHPGRQPCTHPLDDGTFCRQAATWSVAWYVNGNPGITYLAWWCDDHAGDHGDTLGDCDADSACHGRRGRPAPCPAKQTHPHSLNVSRVTAP